MLYAIVDIETTGTYAAANSITELSIHVFDGEKVIEKFETLVNPQQPIPYYIQSFTGITNEMVADAPVFDAIASQVAAILKGKIFVAHNVNFDYSFIKNHLEHAGYIYHEKKLCTVRLSRQIFPGQWSYSLGNLCTSLNIPLKNRHRAGGDALATVQLFHKLLAADINGYIKKSLNKSSKEQVLPPHVPPGDFMRLPHHPGIYYFHDKKGKVIYVGKAVDIRKRVNSHFSNNSDSRQKQNFLKHIHSISFRTCSTELMASILESTEIKRLWPVFNYAQKKREDVYGIYAYTDQNGYLRLAIEKHKKNLESLCRFHYLVDGYAILRNLVKTYQLCNALCNLQKSNGACGQPEQNNCQGACEKRECYSAYNERAGQAILALSQRPSFLIVEESFDRNQQACILVERGKFYGMGDIPAGKNPADINEIKAHIKPYRENSFTRNIVHSYAFKFPEKIISVPDPVQLQSLQHAYKLEGQSTVLTLF